MAEVIDIFTLEQFLEDLVEETQSWVSRHQPQGMVQALQLAEAFSVPEKVRMEGKSLKPGVVTKKPEGIRGMPRTVRTVGD